MSNNDIPYLPSVIPLPLPAPELHSIVKKSKDWALMHGAAMRSRSNFSEDSLMFAPFILLPTAFPRKEFDRAVEIQAIINELMHKVAHNTEFLTNSLVGAIEADAFTGKLFDIYRTVCDEGVVQPISLGLLRSDLMLETCCDPSKGLCDSSLYCCWKQVEVNTIASGFGWLGPVSRSIHRYVLQELGHADKLPDLPENNALQGLCEGMLEAWHLYDNPQSVILFVIEDITYNICDQRFHEFELRRLNPLVTIIRLSLTEIAECATLEDATNQLIIGEQIVGVIYFRAGYEPGHYHSQREWDARLLMERSKAIKCPSIHYHLAGTKKVQEALAKAGALEIFLNDTRKIDAIKKIFTGLYSLDLDEIGDQAVNMALENPERFVLKPQREGGGNNIYGVEIRDALVRMKRSKERAGWILMERIHPPLSRGYMLRPGGPDVPELVDLASELGIFGVVIGDSTKILVNKQVGHMLRTKVSTANEGGVAAGLGALDSPYLI